MTAVERGDHACAMPLGERDNRGIDDAEGKVDVLLGELGDPFPLTLQYRLDEQLPASERPSEGKLGVGSDPICEQVTDLGDHELGDQQRLGRALEEVDTPSMMKVLGRSRGVERSGVDDQHRSARHAVAS